MSLLRHRRHLAPEAAHVLLAVEAPGAAQQPRRVDQVGRADLAHVDPQLGEAAREHAGGAGVVEVDVGEQQRPRLARRARRSSCSSADAGPGIDDQLARPGGRRSPGRGRGAWCRSSDHRRDAYPAMADSATWDNLAHERPPPRAAGPPLGDAHLRRALGRPALERALPAQPRQGPDRASRSPSTCPTQTGYDPDHVLVARRGRQGRRLDRPQGRHAHALRRHPARRDEHLDDDQRDRRLAARPLRHGRRRERGRPRRAQGHDPERHHQGVPLARHLRLPARPLDAADRRHGRLQRQRDPELEPDQRLQLSPAGGRGDPGAGDRLRDVDRDRRPRRGQGARPGRRGGLPEGLRPDLVLRQRRRPLRRGAREAARDVARSGSGSAASATASPTRSCCGCATASRSTASG